MVDFIEELIQEVQEDLDCGLLEKHEAHLITRFLDRVLEEALLEEGRK